MEDDSSTEKHQNERPSGPRAWLAESKDHPVATTALVLCIVAGAILAGVFMPESISPPRRVIGGGIMGGLSWLLVMVGRLIDG
ncbi:MAG: hypothetical protein P8M78_06905 [Myxococcota bacterium]|nr:hypothetical protein [Myxococcota bacterium]